MRLKCFPVVFWGREGHQDVHSLKAVCHRHRKLSVHEEDKKVDSLWRCWRGLGRSASPVGLHGIVEGIRIRLSPPAVDHRGNSQTNLPQSHTSSTWSRVCCGAHYQRHGTEICNCGQGIFWPVNAKEMGKNESPNFIGANKYLQDYALQALTDFPYATYYVLLLK